MKKVELCLAKISHFSKLSLFSTNADNYIYAQLWYLKRFYCMVFCTIFTNEKLNCSMN